MMGVIIETIWLIVLILWGIIVISLIGLISFIMIIGGFSAIGNIKEYKVKARRAKFRIIK